MENSICPLQQGPNRGVANVQLVELYPGIDILQGSGIEIIDPNYHVPPVKEMPRQITSHEPGDTCHHNTSCHFLKHPCSASSDVVRTLSLVDVLAGVAGSRSQTTAAI